MPEEYDELIDAYLKGRLEEEDKRKVERLVKEDSSFREAFEFSQQTKKAFMRIEQQRLKARLQALSLNPEPAATVIPQKANPRRWWFAAASVVLIGLTGLIFWIQQPSRNASDLYTAYFEPYPNIVMPITRNETTERSLVSIAYMRYEQGDYAKAYELFEQVIKAGEADSEAPFYQALSAMASNRELEALPLLSAYMDSTNPKLLRQARWYAALAYLNVGKTQEAAGLLAELAASAGFKQKEAKTLQRELMQ